MQKAFMAMVLLAVAASSPAASQGAKKEDGWQQLLKAARDNGYQDGYLDGYDARGGGERLNQCNAAVNYYARKAANAERYEKCISNLKEAVNGPDSYLRQVANQCAYELP